MPMFSPGSPAMSAAPGARRARSCEARSLVDEPARPSVICPGVAFAAYRAVTALFTRDENQAAGHFSATTAIAGMLTFALGAYALLGDMRVAAGAAVAATALLAAREELHGWVEKITWPELRSAVVL